MHVNGSSPSPASIVRARARSPTLSHAPPQPPTPPLSPTLSCQWATVSDTRILLEDQVLAINIYPEFLCPSPSQPKLNTESLPSSILESPPTVTHKILNQSAQEEPRQSAAVKFALELQAWRSVFVVPGSLGSENVLLCFIRTDVDVV